MEWAANAGDRRDLVIEFATETHGERSSVVDADGEDACAVEGFVCLEQFFDESFEEGDIVVLA